MSSQKHQRVSCQWINIWTSTKICEITLKSMGPGCKQNKAYTCHCHSFKSSQFINLHAMKSFIHVHMVWKLQEKLQINYLLKNKAIEFYHRQKGNLFTCHKASGNTVMKYDFRKSGSCPNMSPGCRSKFTGHNCNPWS